MVLAARFAASMTILLSSRLALPQDPVTADSCREDLKLFYNAPPISTLPANERNGIIRVVLPDLKASEAKMGFDPRDITPEHRFAAALYGARHG
jgi:hypothetical protein